MVLRWGVAGGGGAGRITGPRGGDARAGTVAVDMITRRAAVNDSQTPHRHEDRELERLVNASKCHMTE